MRSLLLVRASRQRGRAAQHKGRQLRQPPQVPHGGLTKGRPSPATCRSIPRPCRSTLHPPRPPSVSEARRYRSTVSAQRRLLTSRESPAAVRALPHRAGDNARRRRGRRCSLLRGCGTRGSTTPGTPLRPATAAGHPGPRRDGDPRPLADQPHAWHVLPRRAEPAQDAADRMGQALWGDWHTAWHTNRSRQDLSNMAAKRACAVRSSSCGVPVM